MVVQRGSNAYPDQNIFKKGSVNLSNEVFYNFPHHNTKAFICRINGLEVSLEMLSNGSNGEAIGRSLVQRSHRLLAINLSPISN